MNGVSQDLVDEARFALDGRILRCPFGENPIECPLHELRKQPVEDRLAWLESKSDEEVVDLYRLHTDCMACKLDKYDD